MHKNTLLFQIYDVEQREATNRVWAGVEVKVYLPLTRGVFSCCSTVTDKNQWKCSNLHTRRQENDMIALHKDKFNCVPPALRAHGRDEIKRSERPETRTLLERGSAADQTLAALTLWFLICFTSGKSNCGCPKGTLEHENMKKQTNFLSLCCSCNFIHSKAGKSKWPAEDIGGFNDLTIIYQLAGNRPLNQS